MKFFLKKYQVIVVILLASIKSQLAGVTYISTASSSANWSGTSLDAYQSASKNFSSGGSASKSLNTNDTLRGFFMFKGGMTGWSSSNTSLTWDGEGQIDGSISIPLGGSLILTSNLRLGSQATLSPGATGFTIQGGGKTLVLEGSGVSLSVTCSIATSSLTIDGQNHLVTLSNTGGGGSFYTAPGLILYLRNLTLKTQTISQQLFQSTGSYILENSTLQGAASNGSTIRLFNSANNNTLTIGRDVRLVGFNQTFNIGGAITIGSNSMLYIGPGVTVYGISSITMTDATSILYLDGCTFYTGSGASARMNLTKGTVIFDNQVKIVNAVFGSAVNTSMANGFILGDGTTASNDVNVLVQSGAYVIVQGCMQMNNAA